MNLKYLLELNVQISSLVSVVDYVVDYGCYLDETTSLFLVDLVRNKKLRKFVQKRDEMQGTNSSRLRSGYN